MNRVAKTYFWSDLHLGSSNLIRFDKRPFNSVDHMHRVLINNYQSIVAPKSVCYFIGDIGNKYAVREIIPQMTNGTKVLIRGNHDKRLSDNFLYSYGFDVILYRADITIAKEPVTLTHCPFLGVFREDVTGMNGAKEGDNWHGESWHGLYSCKDDGQFLLHGHIHSGPHRGDKKTIQDRMWDVGVAANNYRPISISKIESWITKYKKGE